MNDIIHIKKCINIKVRFVTFEIIKKIGEEYQELINSKNNDEEIEELADLFELIITLSGVFGLTIDELNVYRINKKEKRGGFGEKIFLIDVED